ncbi:unnamed protein product [Notodromas monacha]|uniref:Transmembrane protein 14C n=1 Tax=Notodromas monacha TaxID=399045 RepID=A0A7R9BMP6_9CRUS|nr:unnamed protein product [Notodromas monacha]CAG0917513.1 unnamed protein product [Notodromas monacha]
MTGTDWLGFGYAGVVAAGGLVGYLKAGSIASMLSGVMFGSLLGFGAYQTSGNPANAHVTMVTSAVMSGMMGYRYSNSKKFMPAGLMAILGAVMFARSLYQVYTYSANAKIKQ